MGVKNDVFEKPNEYQINSTYHKTENQIKFLSCLTMGQAIPTIF